MTVVVLAGGMNLPATAQEPSEEFRVNSYTAGLESGPAVASDGEGNFLVVWSNTTQARGLVAQGFDRFGIRRGGEFVVSASGSHPAVAAAADGGFIVVWSHVGIFGRRYDAAGTPLDASAFRISSSTATQTATPDVAADSAGNFVVVWHDRDNRVMFARRIDAAGQPLGPEFRVNAYTTVTASLGAVAVGPDGGFVVVWTDRRYGITAPAVFARRFDGSGNPLGVDFRVSSYTAGLLGSPDVAVDGSGHFVVVWEQSDGNLRGVFGQRLDPSGNRLGAEFLVNTRTLHDQLNASVAAAPDGHFVVAWQSDGTFEDDDNIVAQRFQADGLKTGSEYYVNFPSRRLEAAPAVAARGGDKFVVVYQRRDYFDLSTWDVMGRRYGDHTFFSDGFETGDTSRWSFAATDGGDLAVTGGAGMKGTASGLQAFVNDTKGLYVQDDTPADELAYRARFYFNPGDFDPGEAAGAHRTRIFIAFEENPTRRLLALVLRRIGGQYSLRARVRRDDDSRFDTPFFDITPGPHFVEVRWVRATAPGASDGIFELRIDQVLKASSSTLDNSRSAIDFVRMGALSVKAGAAGTLYFDEFESRQEILIGP